jgi:hypothetical protein
MLFVASLCPTAPLRAAFPDVPFLSFFGRTPLVAWFSTVKQVCYTDIEGERQCMGAPDAKMYNELNVMVPLKRRAFFVPGIYATSELTIKVGRSQGMPKQPTLMRQRVTDRHLRSAVLDGTRRSWVRAQLLGSGRALGRLLSAIWPLRVWPAIFPSGYNVRAQILETPRVCFAYLRAGSLSVEAEWLPHPCKLLPFGLYLPGLRMRLPESHRSLPS